MVKWSAYNPWLLGSVLAAYKIILENFVILTPQKNDHLQTFAACLVKQCPWTKSLIIGGILNNFLFVCLCLRKIKMLLNCPRGNGVMYSELACQVDVPGSIPTTAKYRCFSLLSSILR